MVIAVLLDIVGSRDLSDRAEGQRLLDVAIDTVEEDEPTAVARLAPVVGDEQQGLYARLEDALVATLAIRLVLSEPLDVRFGIGVGEVRTVPSAHGDIPEGPGWWAAREAITHVHALQKRAAPSARTWVVGETRQDAGMSTALVNAYLLSRDHLVGAMSPRERRLAYGRMRGRTQQQLAADEGISQSAVSQALSSGGAPALLEGVSLMRASAAFTRPDSSS